jgi:hypothetical protein
LEEGIEMEALRKIVRTNKKYYNIQLPDWAIGKDVEVIVLPVAAAENMDSDKLIGQQEKRGPLSVLGYAKTFRPTRTTDEWMRDLRDGEIL